MNEFINPNWHVLFLPFPLALLILGVLIELFSFLWPGSSARVGARWMILLGALLTLPTITTGLYAYLDVVKGASAKPEAAWPELAAASRWGAEPWRLLQRHLWLEVSGAAVALLVAIGYLACSDRLRQTLRIPALALLLVSVGLIASGGWYSGEAVYAHGVAVTPPSATPPVLPGQQQAEGAATQPAGGAETEGHGESHGGLKAAAWHRYVPPMQLHLVLVGLTLMLVFAALGATVRRWAVEAPPPVKVVVPPTPLEETVRLAETESPGLAAKPSQVVPLLWLLSLLLAIATAVAGLYVAFGLDWQFKGLGSLLQEAANAAGRQHMESEERRMVLHFLFGASLILFTLLMTLLTRFARRWRIFPAVLLVILVALAGLQVWMGVLLLYELP